MHREMPSKFDFAFYCIAVYVFILLLFAFSSWSCASNRREGLAYEIEKKHIFQFEHLNHHREKRCEIKCLVVTIAIALKMYKL